MPTACHKSKATLDRDQSVRLWDKTNLVRRSSHILTALLVTWASLGAVSMTNAQDAAEKSKPTPSLRDASLEEVQQQYNQASEKVRSSLKQVQAARIRFFNESSDMSENHRDAWQKAIETGKDGIESLRVASMELFRRQEEPSDDVIEVAVRSSLEDVEEERYRVGLEVLKRANTIKPTVRSRALMARVQLLDNEFEAAKEFFDEHPDELESMSDTERQRYAAIDELVSQFKREQRLRESEAQEDDLPRVELTTNAGKIVLELFENQAPQTVANFINLVEQGYYNGVIFHNVQAEFVAQAGAYGVVRIEGVNQIMPRGVRHTIYDENKEPDARKHFRGSLSMANQNSPNTGSGQFFLSLTPQPFLNEHHTVFGHVIEGLSVMADLTVTFKEGEKGQQEVIEDAAPSMILSAKVIRKRDHDYLTVKVGEETKTSTPQLGTEESGVD